MTNLRKALGAACLAAAAGTVPGCAGPGATPAPVLENATFTLAPGRSVALGPDATLRFERVADSRCPPGAKCIWAGKLAYQFTLTAKGASEAPHRSEMFELDAAAPRHASTVLPGVTIALAGDSAAPPKSVPGTVADVPVSVSVTVGK